MKSPFFTLIRKDLKGYFDQPTGYILIVIFVAMLSWAMYSALLRKKKFELSQTSLLEVIISAGLIFLLPAYIIEMALGYRLNIDLPFALTLTYVVLFSWISLIYLLDKRNCDNRIK